MPEVERLLENLKNSDWWTREKNIQNLVSLPEDRYLPVLEEWLRDGDDAMLRNAAMEVYRALGPRALTSLAFLLKEDDTDVRVFSANVLGDIGGWAALHALVDALDDPDDNVRVAVIEAIGKTGDERAVRALSESLDDVAWAALAAIEAMGAIGGDDALSVLHGCLENDEYCGMACTALERAGNRSSLEYLFACIEREEVREPALKAVVRIAEREGVRLTPSSLAGFVPLLMELQRSPREETRRAALVALSWAEDIRGLPALISSLSEDGLQEDAVNGIIALGKEAVPDIVMALEKQGGSRGVLAKLLSMAEENEALLLFAGDDDAEVRVEAALALGCLKTGEAEGMLMLLAHDPAEEVRAAALVSLKKLGRTL